MIHQPRDRREILERVETRAGVKVRIDRQDALMHHNQRMAIRPALRRRFCAQITAGAGPIFDHHRLTECRAEALRDPACADVDRAARRGRGDKPDGLRRVLLCRGLGGEQQGQEDEIAHACK